MSLSRAVSAVVVDASATIEMLEGEAVWLERFRSWRVAGVLVLAPAHFRVEVANALVQAVRLQPVDAISRLRQLFAAGVDIADRGLVGTFDAIELAARHDLTVYDAAYLGLALDVDGELATTDRALAAAAAAEGVTVVS